MTHSSRRAKLEADIARAHASLQATEDAARRKVAEHRSQGRDDLAEKQWEVALLDIRAIAASIERLKAELSELDDHQPLNLRRTGMNYSSAVFLINKNVRAVKCTYEPKEGAGSKPTEYTFKTLDATIAPDDLVVVPTDTRHKMTVVKVSAVDVDIDLDDASTQFKWIIAKVDDAAYRKVLADEAQAIKVIRMAEFNKKRADLREGLIGASMDEIKALPIATLNGPSAGNESGSGGGSAPAA